MNKPEKDQLTDTYHKLVSLYDLAEEMISTIDHPDIIEPEEQLLFMEPLVEDIEKATDILTEEYRRFAENTIGKNAQNIMNEKVENALCLIYQVLEELKKAPYLPGHNE